jgi:ATP-dependent helicase/DNAse subunit B
MPNQLTIVTGPPAVDLTSHLLPEFAARARASIGSVLWLTPTELGAHEVRRRLAAEHGATLRPNVHSIAAFAEKLAPRNAGRGGSPRSQFEEAVRELVNAGELEYYRGVAESRGFLAAAEGLIEELASAAIDPAEFAAAVRHSPGTKLAACSRLYSAVAGRGDCPDMVAAAAAALCSRSSGSGVATGVFLDGFISFTGSQWKLVKAFAGHADLWVSLPRDEREAFAGVTDLQFRLTGLFSEKQVFMVRTARNPADLPAGLGRLGDQLFTPDSPPSAAAAGGVHLIEAPGPVGEARMVARRIKRLLASGIRPERVAVTMRDLTYSADLIEEVFGEYGIPCSVERESSLIRNPAVASLLRAARIADAGFPFADVTALLRSTYFRPAWPEAAGDTVRKSETLLRLLGEARGRESYLSAIRMWSEDPPEGLEDEQAEESRRARKARLARECRPFLELFFSAWESLPASGSAADYAGWLRQFAGEIGLSEAAREVPTDSTALEILWDRLSHGTGDQRAAEFIRKLPSVAVGELLPRGRARSASVRGLSAEEACNLECDHLFVMGLGERSFPRLSPPQSLLDDADRIALRGQGLALEDPESRLAGEQLLFLRLVARPKRELVLSYPAVDGAGQPLLPGSFLRAVRQCFTVDAIPVERQSMLIEGFATREALSASELRVQYAVAAEARCLFEHGAIPLELREHLRWAEQAANGRFRSKEFSAFDGFLEDTGVRAEMGNRFGPERVFSPTTLETYVACPFRFLLQHVLGLHELEEPGEEVEHTRRGAAFHRALARLHRQWRQDQPTLPLQALPEKLDQELVGELDRAVAEYARRAGSPASRRLWELEGLRLHRSANRYRGHWESFLKPWREAAGVPTPEYLEADFGLSAAARVASMEGDVIAEPLVIGVGGVEVRIGGRIDRVDLVQLEDGIGFWIIDYKSGRSNYYSAPEIERFEKLQLSLYALAVEKVLLAGQNARPLGLAYWLVTDTGPKAVLPQRKPLAWVTDAEKWRVFSEQLEAWVAKVVGRIRDGSYPLAPRSPTCTDTCPFGQACRISQSRSVGKTWELSSDGATR